MLKERLKELRKENGVTQQQMSASLGCSQSMIARWESGECEPTESVIRNVAEYFSVSVDYLLGISEV